MATFTVGESEVGGLDTLGSITIEPAGIASAEAFGTGVVDVTWPVTLVGVGAVAEGSTSCAPAFPVGYTPVAGDLAVVVVASGHTTAGTIPTANNSFAQITAGSTFVGGGGTFGAGTGPRRITYLVKTLVGADSAPTVSLATGNVLSAAMIVLSKTAAAWSLGFASGEDTASGTSFSAVCSSSPGLIAGDLAVLGYAISDDLLTMSAQALTATGATVGTVTERIDDDNATGNDLTLGVATAQITAGASILNPTIAATLTTAEVGAAGILRVRAGVTATTPPTVAAYSEVSSWTSSSTPKATGSVTWQAGDIIVAIAATQDNAATVSTPTATGLTFQAATPVNVTNHCWTNLWIATPTSGSSGAVSFASADGLSYGGAVWVLRGSGGVGAAASASGTTKVVSLSRTNSESLVVGGVFDWDAGSTAGFAFTPTLGAGTSREVAATATYSIFVADWGTQGAVAATSYGITGTASTGNHSKMFVEITGAGPQVVSPTGIASGEAVGAAAVGNTGIAFRAEAGGDGNLATITVTVPAAVEPGDGMLIFWAHTDAQTDVVPDGWTEIGRLGSGSLTSVALARLAEPGEAGSVVSLENSGINRQHARFVAYSGVLPDFVDAVASRGESVSGTTHLTPTLNTVAAGCSVVHAITERSSTVTTDWTPPGGYIERSEGQTSGTGGTDAEVADALAPVAAGTLVGGGTYTGGATSSVAVVTWTVSLAPDVGPVFRDATAVFNDSASASTTGSMAGMVDGDLVLAEFVSSDTVAGVALTVEPAGWTVLRAHTSFGTASSALYYRVKAAGDSDPVWTLAAARDVQVVLAAYSGVDPTGLVDVWDAAGRGGSSTTTTAPTVTTTGAKRRVVRIYGEKSTTATSVTDPTGTVRRVASFGAGATTSSALVVDSLLEAAGATGTADAVYDVASGNGIGHTVALEPVVTSLTVSPAAIATGEAFGSAAVGLGIAASGIASGEAFGTAVLSPGPVTVTASGVASGEAFGTAALTFSHVPFAVLADDFADGSIDTGRWPTVSGGVSETGGRLRVPVTTGFEQAQSASVYELAGSHVSVRLYPHAAGGATSEAHADLFVVTDTAGTDAGFVYDAIFDVISFALRAGFADPGLVVIGYDPVAHRYLRLRETGGNVLWETAPDGATWTTRRTEAAPSWVTDDGDLALLLITHRSDGTPDHAEFDNVNVPGQVIAPSGIATGEAFGTAQLTPGAVTVAPSGIASGEAFGAAAVRLTVAPSGIGTAEALGTPTLTVGAVTITAAGIGTGETFGTAQLSPGPVTVSPAGIVSGETVPAPAVTVGAVTLAPSGVASGEAFGSAALAAGPVTVTAAGIGTAEAFGAATVTPGAVVLSPAGIGTGEAVGGPTLTAGAVTITPSGIATGEAFGAAAVRHTVTASGIATGEAFGVATVTTGPVTVSPSGVATGEAFGSPLVSAGTLTVVAVGIVSAEAFGTAAVSSGPVTIAPAGVVSAEAFGTATVAAGGVTVSPAGVGTAEAFGAVTVTLGAALVAPTGIPTAEAVGAAHLTTGAVTIVVAGADSAEVFGTPTLTAGPVTVTPAGIGTAEAIGAAQLSPGPVTITPAGVASAAAVGAHQVLVGAVTIVPAGIGTAEAFGVAVVAAPWGIPSAEAFGVPVVTRGLLPGQYPGSGGLAVDGTDHGLVSVDGTDRGRVTPGGTDHGRLVPARR